MEIPLSAVLGAFATIISIAVSIALVLGRAAITTREAEINRRLDEHARVITSTDMRLHVEEKATIRQDGDVALVKARHDGLHSDLEEIKSNMVTKAEFMSLERALNQIFNDPYRGYQGQRPSAPYATQPGPPRPRDPRDPRDPDR